MSVIRTKLQNDEVNKVIHENPYFDPMINTYSWLYTECISFKYKFRSLILERLGSVGPVVKFDPDTL